MNATTTDPRTIISTRSHAHREESTRLTQQIIELQKHAATLSMRDAWDLLLTDMLNLINTGLDLRNRFGVVYIDSDEPDGDTFRVSILECVDQNGKYVDGYLDTYHGAGVYTPREATFLDPFLIDGISAEHPVVSLDVLSYFALTAATFHDARWHGQAVVDSHTYPLGHPQCPVSVKVGA